jgi:SAM-dependent methyltransferase
VPSIEVNVAVSNGDTWWRDAGEEWSAPWGGSDAQWLATFLPRLRSFLPAATLLEIAPGHGRWTAFLKDHCERLIGVDVSERCVDACRERFRDDDRLTFAVNDGLSLDAVHDGTVDLAVSLDSLVHVEADVMQSYIQQLARKLRPTGGVAFLHHSNLGQYEYYQSLRRIKGATRLGWATGLVERDLHWRSFSVSATKVKTWAAASGLACTSQELVNWRTRRALIDCFTVLVRDAAPAREAIVVRNRQFMDEARRAKQLASTYRRDSQQRSELGGGSPSQ